MKKLKEISILLLAIVITMLGLTCIVYIVNVGNPSFLSHPKTFVDSFRSTLVWMGAVIATIGGIALGWATIAVLFED